MCETKIVYVIKVVIPQYVHRKLIKDVADTPFSSLFDKATKSQVKKQYGEYVMYWSKQDCRVVSRYCSSSFVGHCDADTLVKHYVGFVKALELDSSMLLHFGMDASNTNLSFERKMAKYLEEMNTTFLMIGTCSLHPVHSAFSKSIK